MFGGVAAIVGAMTAVAQAEFEESMRRKRNQSSGLVLLTALGEKELSLAEYMALPPEKLQWVRVKGEAQKIAGYYHRGGVECDYCGTSGGRDSAGHCVNCGAS